MIWIRHVVMQAQPVAAVHAVSGDRAAKDYFLAGDVGEPLNEVIRLERPEDGVGQRWSSPALVPPHFPEVDIPRRAYRSPLPRYVGEFDTLVLDTF